MPNITPVTSPTNPGPDFEIARGQNIEAIARNLGTQVDSAATDSTGSWSLIALFKRLLGFWTAPGSPSTTAAVTVQQAASAPHFDNTAATIAGASFVALPAHACHSVTFVLPVPCDVQGAGDTAYAPYPAGAMTVAVAANSSELTFRQSDHSAVAVVIPFEFNS